MESPRLRKLMALARWYDESAPDADPSSDAEFMTGARKIMGLDPVTGTRVVDDVLRAAVDAARADDLARLHALVDWPLSGAGQVGQALSGVLERDRAEVAAMGLAELDAAAADPGMVEELLRPLAGRLAGAREIRRADAEAGAAALAAVRVPPPPPGLTSASRDRLTALAERAASLHDVYVIADDHGETPVIVATDLGLLVLDPA